MTGWVNYEQKEYAIAFDADRRCVYLDRNAGEKLFVTGKSCGTFYCYAAVCLGSVIRLLLDRFDRQNEEKAKQEQEEKEKALQEEEAAGSQEDTAQKGVSDSNG